MTSGIPRRGEKEFNDIIQKYLHKHQGIDDKEGNESALESVLRPQGVCQACSVLALFEKLNCRGCNGDR